MSKMLPSVRCRGGSPLRSRSTACLQLNFPSLPSCLAATASVRAACEIQFSSETADAIAIILDEETLTKPSEDKTPMPVRSVLIVGAGPAGAALAYLLARRGCLSPCWKGTSTLRVPSVERDCDPAAWTLLCRWDLLKSCRSCRRPK
jgi:hypothetical protein